MLSIVQGSSLDDASIARLAAEQAKANANLATAPMWFAMWVGVDPAVAIHALASRLAEIKAGITDPETYQAYPVSAVKLLKLSRPGRRAAAA